MVRESPSNGENLSSEADLLQNPNNGETLKSRQSPCFSEEIDSACSTPYVSAPSSPGRGPSRYFYSAPASPMQFVLSSFASSSDFMSSSSSEQTVPGQVEFEFSARLCCNSWNAGSMSSAEELFLNGQIRPMKLSSHLQRPQVLTPLLDLDVEEEEEDGSREAEMVKREDSMVRGRDLRLRDRSLHRRSRSLSPLRNNAPFQWREEEDDQKECVMDQRDVEIEEQSEMESAEAAPSVSASSSRSSSSGRSSKRWAFLKDFLRSKSEGRGNAKDKYFWYSMSFSPAKEKKTQASHSKEKKTTEAHKPAKKNSVANPASSGGKGRSRQSPHELHYTANRAQAEEMKKRTYLPYRQGLLGCLGFSSKSYGAMNGFARALNPVSSR